MSNVATHPTGVTYKIKAYINGMLRTFDVNPADSDYEVGYQAALEELEEYIERVESGTDVQETSDG